VRIAQLLSELEQIIRQLQQPAVAHINSNNTPSSTRGNNSFLAAETRIAIHVSTVVSMSSSNNHSISTAEDSSSSSSSIVEAASRSLLDLTNSHVQDRLAAIRRTVRFGEKQGSI
jgi:hypothetical protein